MSESLQRVYIATPSRLADRTNEISTFFASHGYLPLHPFNAYPLSLFEANPVYQTKPKDRIKIRRATMKLCLEDVRRCHRFALCGISNGTLIKAREALKRKKPIGLYPRFDPDWEKEAAHLAFHNKRHAKTLRRLGITT